MDRAQTAQNRVVAAHAVPQCSSNPEARPPADKKRSYTSDRASKQGPDPPRLAEDRATATLAARTRSSGVRTSPRSVPPLPAGPGPRNCTGNADKAAGAAPTGKTSGGQGTSGLPHKGTWGTHVSSAVSGRVPDTGPKAAKPPIKRRRHLGTRLNRFLGILAPSPPSNKAMGPTVGHKPRSMARPSRIHGTWVSTGAAANWAPHHA